MIVTFLFLDKRKSNQKKNQGKQNASTLKALAPPRFARRANARREF